MKYKFTKTQIDTVVNLITDGATDEQIIVFAEKNLKLNKEASEALILACKPVPQDNEQIKAEEPNADAPSKEETPAKEKSGDDQPKEEEKSGESAPAKEDDAPSDGEQPKEEFTNAQIIDQCVEKIEGGNEITEADIIEEFKTTVADAKSILGVAKRKVIDNHRNAEAEEANKVKEKKSAEIAGAIEPVMKNIDTLLASIEKAIDVKRKHGSGFSRLLGAKKDLTRLKKAIA